MAEFTGTEPIENQTAQLAMRAAVTRLLQFPPTAPFEEFAALLKELHSELGTKRIGECLVTAFLYQKVQLTQAQTQFKQLREFLRSLGEQ